MTSFIQHMRGATSCQATSSFRQLVIPNFTDAGRIKRRLLKVKALKCIIKIQSMHFVLCSVCRATLWETITLGISCTGSLLSLQERVLPYILCILYVRYITEPKLCMSLHQTTQRCQFLLSSSFHCLPHALVLQARPSWPSHLHGNPGAPAIGRGQPQRHSKPWPCERPPAEEHRCGGGLHEASRAARQPQRVHLHPLTHFCWAGVCICCSLLARSVKERTLLTPISVFVMVRVSDGAKCFISLFANKDIKYVCAAIAYLCSQLTSCPYVRH